MTIYILLTTPGTDAGPFNIYSDVDGYISAFATNVSKPTLSGGYVSNAAPNGTTIVRLVSVGECTNYIDFEVGGGPIPTTSTTTSTTTINAFSWYYGRYSSPGGIVPIPRSVDIDISTGTLVTAVDPSGPIIIPFNSANDDFLWFAIPVSANGKTNWFVNSLNQGLIGGPSNQLGNLFPDPIYVTHLGVPFYLYISTARTNVTQMTISGTVIIPPIVPSLVLEISNIPGMNLIIGDVSDVNDWNTALDLPTYGNPFTSVQVLGNYVRLTGGSDVNLQSSIFTYSGYLLSIDDQIGSVLYCNDYAFVNCYKLESVSFPALISLGDGVFETCYELKSINLPLCDSAGYEVFRDCTNLVSVNLPSLTTINYRGFFSCESLVNINLPLLDSASYDLFTNCTSLITANLPVLTSVAEDTFSYCTSLTTVNLPMLANIGQGTFYGCTSLSSVSLPSLTYLEDVTFADCTSLTTVNLPAVIGALDSVFMNCTALTTINLPTLTSLGYGLFENCTSLTSISLPSCTDLGGSVLDNNVFFGISGNTMTLTIPTVLMTANAGNPDGDIQYLQANNTVTIITV